MVKKGFKIRHTTLFPLRKNQRRRPGDPGGWEWKWIDLRQERFFNQRRWRKSFDLSIMHLPFIPTIYPVKPPKFYSISLYINIFIYIYAHRAPQSLRCWPYTYIYICIYIYILPLLFFSAKVGESKIKISGFWALKLTAKTPEKDGMVIPTIHFQRLWLLVFRRVLCYQVTLNLDLWL